MSASGTKRTWRLNFAMSANDPKRTLFALTAEAEAKRPAGAPYSAGAFCTQEQRVGFRWPPFFVGGGGRVTGTLPQISASEQTRTNQKMLEWHTARRPERAARQGVIHARRGDWFPDNNGEWQ